MPYFYTDFKIGEMVALDEEGAEYLDQAAAEVEARCALLNWTKYYLRFDEMLELNVAVREGVTVVFSATAQAVCRLL